ncbi:MAG TPA: rhodanese-like domain-containing protein [Polyangia bacterium]
MTILRRQTFPALLVQACLLTALGALVGLGVNAVRAKRLPLVASSFDYQVRCEEAAVESKNRTFTVEEVEKLLGKPDVAVVDIRDAEAYAKGHLPRARSLPVSVLAPTDPAALAALLKFRQVVVYDEGNDLAKAEEFAGELKGAKDVRFLGVGYAGWIGAGRAITAGNQP